ncbi:hypothetical protein B0H14DRAFT_3082527 [Mycena olivaceomarginata]|nr:hypothetical protein B0H14DRAFT_3082527 [Mycena olivaceomarginata]
MPQHEHSKTCFKYWQGPPEPRTCRCDLHEDNPASFFDPEPGELSLQCLDGLVNNFNSTVPEGILYYIKDYITKSQLKTHVALRCWSWGQKLGNFNPLKDDPTTRAKKMLQKCAYAMISQGIVRAADHFTSHLYRNFYWGFSRVLSTQEMPSPDVTPQSIYHLTSVE